MVAPASEPMELAALPFKTALAAWKWFFNLLAHFMRNKRLCYLCKTNKLEQCV
jgi:hypothetical protein